MSGRLHCMVLKKIQKVFIFCENAQVWTNSPWAGTWSAKFGQECSLTPVYTIQPVVKPVWQPAVSCKQTSNRLLNRCLYTRYSRLTNLYRLSNGFDNRFDNYVERTDRSFNMVVKLVVQPGLTTVLNEQPLFVQPVVKPGCTTRYCHLSNRLSVECLYTRYNRFDSGFDNWLYRAYKQLPGCQTRLTTGLATGCFV